MLRKDYILNVRSDNFQTTAIAKSLLPDAGYCAGNGNLGDVFATAKSIIADASNRVGFVLVLYRGGYF